MIIDLRSDTVTKPIEEMRQAMAAAEVGDDVYGEDPSVIKLEQMAAEITGKEAGLFVPTGTMGNQLAVLTHCGRREELICQDNSHIYCYECGGAAVLAGVQIRPIPAARGILTPEILESHWDGDDIHVPVSRLIWVENTHNRSGGTIFPLETLKEVQKWSKEKGLKTHMDGARIFNASVASGVSVREYAATVDSMMFCISKGLGAPVGSVLVGDKEFIKSARRWRKMLGGGMRQAGILAAAGIYALTHRVERLAEDHRFAKELAMELQKIGYELPTGLPETNIVMVQAPKSYPSDTAFTAKLKEEGIIASAFGQRVIRLTTHQNVSIDLLPNIIEVFKKVQEA